MKTKENLFKDCLVLHQQLFTEISKCFTNWRNKKMRVLRILLLSCLLTSGSSDDPAGKSRPIRSRSDIPIEDDLVGYREMDHEIRADLDRFEAIKQVNVFLSNFD